MVTPSKLWYGTWTFLVWDRGATPRSIDQEPHPHRAEHDVVARAYLEGALRRDPLAVDEGPVGGALLADEETLATPQQPGVLPAGGGAGGILIPWRSIKLNRS